MYLRCCRPELQTDPLLFLPMSAYDRNRLFRWRRGWLSSKPDPCTNCNGQHLTTRDHLLHCYNLISLLGLRPPSHELHPLDTLLNRLPRKAPKSEPLKTETYFYWLHRWPLILHFLKNIDHQLYEDSPQVMEAMVTKPELLLKMLHPDK